MVIPRVPGPQGWYGSVLDPSDTSRIVAATGLSASDECLDVLGRAIVGAVDRLLLPERDWATAGEASAWLRRLEEASKVFLDCFDSPDPVEAGQQVLRGPKGWIDHPALASLDVRQEVRSAIVSVRAIATRASIAASRYDAEQNPGRRAPESEVHFFRTVSDSYTTAFGRKGFSRNASGVASGPQIRLFLEIGTVLAGKEVWPNSLEAADTVRRLRNPEGIAERLRK